MAKKCLKEIRERAQKGEGLSGEGKMKFEEGNAVKGDRKKEMM